MKPAEIIDDPRADAPNLAKAVNRENAPAGKPAAAPHPAPETIEAPVAPPARWNPPARTAAVRLSAAALVIIAIAAILYAWQLPPFKGHYEETDNAYVKGETTVISPQVSGYVAEVAVQGFEQVREGQLLVRIDPRTYAARVAQAQANLMTQRTALDNSSQTQRSREAGELAGDAAIFNAEAQLRRVQADSRRIEALVEKGWVTSRDRDQQQAALRAAEAQLRQARAAREINRQDVRSVMVGRAGLSANVAASRAQVRLAELDLEHTVIRAPRDGQLSEVAVRHGQFVSAGTQLMFLVPGNHWVSANFREAQTRRMRPGQRASFTVDGLGGERIMGEVESLAPAAGSEFALLKPDNATGNFVKVAQRIAVRIRINPGQPMAERLRPGMSVIARVDTSS